MCFQDVDYAKIKPVRYGKLNHAIDGLCVSGSWLVVADWVNTSLYSLPDLALHHQVTVERCVRPRVDTTGLVYVPTWLYNGHIAVLQITASGRLEGIRNITAVGGYRLHYPVVAVGPQPGQLCVGQSYPVRLSVINTTEDRLVQEVTLPDQCGYLLSVAALDSGQLMISYFISYPDNHSLAFYASVADSPTVLYNMSAVADWVVALLAHGQHFLAAYVFKADLMVVGSGGSVLHTVDAVSGKLGVYLHGINDVAVWQDCVWLGGGYGDLILLCAD